MRLIFALAAAALTLSPGVVAAQKDLWKLDISPSQPVTLTFEKTPLSEVLRTLEEMVNVEIRLAPEIDGTQPVTARLRNAPFTGALDLLVKSQKLKYEVLAPKILLISAGDPPIRLLFEIYRNGELVAQPVILVVEKTPGSATIDGLGTVTFTPTRLDAERIALAFEISAGGQPLTPEVVLRNREPGAISWTSASGDNVELRVISP